MVSRDRKRCVSLLGNETNKRLAVCGEWLSIYRHASNSISSALVMYPAELITSSLTVRDMIGLSVGKAFASAASNSGLNRSSTARNISTAFRISVRRSCTVWHALSSVDTLAKRLAMFVVRRFAAVRRTSTVCSRSDMVTVGVSQRAVVPLMVKIRDRSTVCFQITSGSPIVKTVIK